MDVVIHALLVFLFCVTYLLCYLLPNLDESLPDVLPDEYCTGDVYIHGTDDAFLWYFNTHVQVLDQLHWNPLLLVPDKTKN